jgi:hypothetical protein
MVKTVSRCIVDRAGGIATTKTRLTGERAALRASASRSIVRSLRPLGIPDREQVRPRDDHVAPLQRGLIARRRPTARNRRKLAEPEDPVRAREARWYSKMYPERSVPQRAGVRHRAADDPVADDDQRSR